MYRTRDKRKRAGADIIRKTNKPRFNTDPKPAPFASKMQAVRIKSGAEASTVNRLLARGDEGKLPFKHGECICLLM